MVITGADITGYGSFPLAQVVVPFFMFIVRITYTGRGQRDDEKAPS